MLLTIIETGDNMDYAIVLIRTAIFYVLITIIYRIMGKREVGQLGIVDLIVSILIAELAAISIDNRDESIFLSIIPILLLVAIQIAMALVSMKNAKVRDIFDGKPSIIINRGLVNFKEMVKQRYNMDDLLTQLRQQHIRSIEAVDFAILETSGKLSIFQKDSKLHGDYPLPLILDGTIQFDTLRQLGKGKEWLEKMLKHDSVKLENIFYGFYRQDKLFVIKKTDLIQ